MNLDTMEITVAPDFKTWLENQKSANNFKTDGQLADFLNVRQDTLSMILTGKRGPSAQFVQTIMESRDIWPGSSEYSELLRAAHITNLEQEKRRRRPAD